MMRPTMLPIFGSAFAGVAPGPTDPIAATAAAARKLFLKVSFMVDLPCWDVAGLTPRKAVYGVKSTAAKAGKGIDGLWAECCGAGNAGPGAIVCYRL